MRANDYHNATTLQVCHAPAPSFDHAINKCVLASRYKSYGDWPVSESTEANANEPIGIMQYSAALPPLPRYIRRSELRQVVPLGDTAIYEMERRNEFPRRIVLMPRVVVWSLAEVEAWVQQKRRDTESGKVRAAKVGARKRQKRTASASR